MNHSSNGGTKVRNVQDCVIDLDKNDKKSECYLGLIKG